MFEVLSLSVELRPHNKVDFFDIVRKEKIMIQDPFRKSFGKKAKMSLVGMISQNKELLNIIIKNKTISKQEISPEIISFLKSQEKIIKREKPKDVERILKEAWEKRNGSDKTLEKSNKLIEGTLAGTVIWYEKLNICTKYNVHQKYCARYKDYDYWLMINGHVNGDNEMKLSMTFQKNDKNGIKKTYDNKYAMKVFKAIRKVGVHKNESAIYKKNNSHGENKNEIFIKSSDFVVRSNLFKCYHNEHVVEEIIGIVKVVDRLGIEREKKIPCAYCQKCNCFFMLISEYKKLSACGRILCQLIDKENYYATGNLNSFNYNSESLLMINGYNVKANNGLTEAQRQVILKNIMENKILSPHRIVSYLDMFIAQKEHMPIYKEAVEKWRKDREYVLKYKSNEKRTVKIETIKR